MNTNTYLIKKGDCLSLLAIRFNTTVTELQRLNSDQIKDIHLIYAGRQIVTPDTPGGTETIELDKETERIPLPTYKKSQTVATGANTCSDAKVDYIDILYVANHPKTNEPEWYALSEDALKAIQEEINILGSAIIPGDLKATHAALVNLGVMSKFSGYLFEQFLNKDDREKYINLLLCRQVIKVGADKFYRKNNRDFFEALVESGVADIDESEWRNYSILKDYLWGYKKTIKIGDDYPSVAAFSKEERSYRYAREKFHKTVLDSIEYKIEELEERAIKIAHGEKTDDGTRFFYEDRLGYFTSRYENAIRKDINNIRSLIDSYYYTQSRLIFSSPEENRRLIERTWGKELPSGAKKIKDKGEFYDATRPAITVRVLNRINRHGYALREQCLTLSQLVGTEAKHYGPEEMIKVFSEEFQEKQEGDGNKKCEGSGFEDNIENNQEWREREGVLIREARTVSIDMKVEVCGKKGSVEEIRVFSAIYRRLNPQADQSDSYLESLLNTVGKVEWAYYPTKSLIEIIDATLERHNGLKDLLGGSLPEGFFEAILWVKKVAKTRLDRLDDQANRRAGEGRLIYCYLEEKRPGSFFFRRKNHLQAKREKKGVFKNKAGKADLQVVECSLLSDGKVFYLRSSQDYMPVQNEDEQCLGYVKNITRNISINSAVAMLGREATVKKALLETLKSTEVKWILGDFGLKKEVQFDSVFWHGNLHSQWKPVDNGETAYLADAEAQFLRFSAKAEAFLDHPFDDTNLLTIPKSLNGNAKVNLELTVARGQLSFETWLPVTGNEQYKAEQKEKVSGWSLDIDYVKRLTDEGEPEIAVYPAGELCLYLQASVYGLAAASCALGTGFALGTSSIGGTGVRGRALIDANHPNRFVREEWQSIEETIPAKAQAGANIDVFAGVEVGGHVGAKLFWRPPSNEKGECNQKLLLGGISAQLAASAGVGFSGEIKLAFSNNKLLLVVGARVVKGLGANGKVCIEINPLNADRFIACLLGVLNQSGFQRLAIFGDADDFDILNSMLTIAIARGLTFGQVLLLPSTFYLQYKAEENREEFAPFVAEAILGKSGKSKTRAKTQEWVQSAPPETLSKLLTLLITAQDYKIEWGKEEIEENIKSKNKNIDQANAVIHVMTWIANNPKSMDDVENSRKQFEKTLYRMGNYKHKDSIGYIQKWQRFYLNWNRVSFFVNNNLPDDEEGNNSRREFSRLSSKLCSNMRCLQVSKEILGVITLNEILVFDNYPNRHNDPEKIAMVSKLKEILLIKTNGCAVSERDWII